MLLDEIVRTSEAVAATRSRLAKVNELAGLLRRLDPEDIPTAVGLLAAKPRQGRVGIGWSGMRAARVESAPEPHLTIADLDAALDRLLAAGGIGSTVDRAATLRTPMAEATEREQAFIAGVLLGELRTGALEGVLTDAIARAAGRPVEAVRRAAMLSGDLGGTALLAITGTAAQLNAVGLVVGRPVQPMLAATAASTSEALEATGEASVEYKLDGARIQVHRAGDDVRIFTRTLADVTHRLPEVVEVVRGLPVRDVILDGETLALDEDGGPRPFQETMSRFGADAARTTLLHPWFFDVLHINGRDLLDEPLSTRIGVLERIAPGHRIPGKITGDAAVAERVSRDALAAGHEGVVVNSLLNERVDAVQEGCVLCKDGVFSGCRRAGPWSRSDCWSRAVGMAWRRTRSGRVSVRGRRSCCRRTARSTGGWPASWSVRPSPGWSRSRSGTT
ncbi:ATP-dependent DNA ligase [Arthrobacter celericrescens]|uniref:ATP-dependent DNA ligase n=1 Tax=Arthrobacter celericrescens TaxID=2320851 RepID=UPI001FE1EB14|nr:ATP-dependent DNA ligase [Arthrobacter celericrescens]